MERNRRMFQKSSQLPEERAAPSQRYPEPPVARWPHSNFNSYERQWDDGNKKRCRTAQRHACAKRCVLDNPHFAKVLPIQCLNEAGYRKAITTTIRLEESGAGNPASDRP